MRLFTTGIDLVHSGLLTAIGSALALQTMLFMMLPGSH